MDIIKGKTWTFGKNIDTDVIIPGRYLRTFNPQDLADHVLEGERPDFTKNVQSGDIIVADENFGCGSSREHAPIAIKASGIDCVIANTFARIFYRNAINIGLPIMECPEASERIQAGDEVEVDFDSGIIKNLTRGEEYKAHPFPESIQKIIRAGGLLKSIAEENE